jgi:hypothetical protein
MEQYPV